MTRGRSIYRMVLALGVAALLAAALPFSVLYVQALAPRVSVVSTGRHPLVTSSSSGAPAAQGTTTGPRAAAATRSS